MSSPLLKKLTLVLLAISLSSILFSGLIINLSLNYQFQDYLGKAEQFRQQQIISSLADLYLEYGGWPNFPLTLRIGRNGYLGNLLYVTNLEGQIVVIVRSRMRPPDNQKLLTIPIRVNGVLVGTAYFSRNNPPNLLTVHDRLFRFTINRSIILTMILTGFISVLVAIIFARKLSTPIMEMNHTAKEMISGNLDSRVRNLPPDEIGELGISLNQLAERLSTVEKLRRKMTADVAHDLRTPLATVRSHLEGMIDQVIPPNRKNLESLMEEVDRLTILIEDLQEIARSDKAIHNFQFEPVELLSFLKETTHKLEPLFKKKKIVLEFSDTEPCTINSDRQALSKILDNLLSNALKFTPSEKKVQLHLEKQENYAAISIVDQGTGIAETDIPFIFERFYRTDRSRNRESGGFGLGLTIVKELTEALGGAVLVESKLGEGSKFTIKLPYLPEKNGQKIN